MARETWEQLNILARRLGFVIPYELSKNGSAVIIRMYGVDEYIRKVLSYLPFASKGMIREYRQKASSYLVDSLHAKDVGL